MPSADLWFYSVLRFLLATLRIRVTFDGLVTLRISRVALFKPSLICRCQCQDVFVLAPAGDRREVFYSPVLCLFLRVYLQAISLTSSLTRNGPCSFLWPSRNLVHFCPRWGCLLQRTFEIYCCNASPSATLIRLLFSNYSCCRSALKIVPVSWRLYFAKISITKLKISGGNFRLLPKVKSRGKARNMKREHENWLIKSIRIVKYP